MSELPRKVLLVDDEPSILSALRRRLSGDYGVETAVSGADGLALLARDPAIAVVVADMQMPGMNGVQFLTRVKAEHPCVRRLMLTGNSDQETAIAAINDGDVMRFLRKPCEIDVLRGALDAALADHAFSLAPIQAEAIGNDRAAEARDAFLSMMNHELRTPLHQIIGFAGILEAAGADDGDRLQHLQQIQASSEHMLSLVNRMLEYSRLKSACVDRLDATFDLIAVAQDTVEQLKRVADSKSVSVSIDAIRRKVMVSGIADEVRLALRELLSNAIRFTAAGGHVSVLVKCEEEKVALRIADTGCGFPEAMMQKIGAPFILSEGGYARRHDGIGLGLALVKTIADMNGCAFELRNVVNGGAAATMILNRAAPARSASAA